MAIRLYFFISGHKWRGQSPGLSHNHTITIPDPLHQYMGIQNDQWGNLPVTLSDRACWVVERQYAPLKLFQRAFGGVVFVGFIDILPALKDGDSR